MKGKIELKNIALEKLAGLISNTLRKHGIESILVGGACVSIYSKNRYQSYDLDYIVYEDMDKVTEALKVLNFQKKGKYYCHPECDFFVDFVSPPVSIGDEPIQHFANYQTSLGTIKMLTPTDCVKDRLASFFHWNDRQGLDQAIEICQEILNQVDLEEIKRWAAKEGFAEKYAVFLKRIHF